MGESLHFTSPFAFLDNHAFAIILFMFLAWSIVFFIFWLGTRKLRMKPGGAQNLVEWAVSYLTNYADDVIGKKAPRYYAIIVTFFFYILISNLMGLVPLGLSPTSMLSVTAALALSVFVMEHFEGIRDKGPVKYVKHFLGPEGIPNWIRPFIFLIEIVSELARPVSLMFRLFGNIMAKEILLGVLIVLMILFGPAVKQMLAGDFSNAIGGGIGIFSFALRFLIIVLGTLFSIVQAAVFTLLTALYIAGAVADHEEEH